MAPPLQNVATEREIYFFATLVGSACYTLILGWLGVTLFAKACERSYKEGKAEAESKIAFLGH